jgi:hypothetical protein
MTSISNSDTMPNGTCGWPADPPVQIQSGVPPTGPRAELTNVCAFDCAAPPFQRRYCDRRRTVLVQRQPLRTALIPCGNLHHSEEDYRWWARLVAGCLRISWAELPPDGTVRVTAYCLDEAGIDRVEQRFLGRLRRRGVTYAWFREWQAPGEGRHLHLAVRSAGSKLALSDIGGLWRGSLPPGGNGSTYAASVRDFIGLAKYLTKDLRQHRIVLPPPEVRYIFYQRPGFLVRPLSQLKNEVRAAWARQRGRG